MASDLGRERPSCSAKVVNAKRDRLVKVVGNHERLGKKSWLCWHNSMEGKRPFSSKLSANSQRHFQPSQAASAQVFNKFTLAERPASGGQPA